MTSDADEGRPEGTDAAREGGDGGPAAPEREQLEVAHQLAVRDERIRQLSEELRVANADLRRTRRELARSQRELEALANRRSVRAVTAVTSSIRRRIRVTRGAAGRARLRLLERGEDEPKKLLRATAAEQRALQKRLDEELRPGITAGPLVSIVVLTRNGADHLRRLFPALAGLRYGAIEVVLVDNASTDDSLRYIEELKVPYPVRVIANDSNRTFSEANNQGAAVATGELLLLLNNDIVPAGLDVLGQMVDRLLADPSIAAVGARLIYPRRKGPRHGKVSRAADLTLQHRGIAFESRGGRLLARNIGGGEDPLGGLASTAVDVPGATAACLLVRRSTFEAVGGFTLGYDYGMEDVDLCMKLRATGGRIVYEPQATFWHHESATQRAEATDARLARHQANRQRFDDLWGPRVFREVLLDRLTGSGTWSTSPLHVGITLTKDDPAAGYGDWHTGHELGDAIAALGWRVSYLERHGDAWYEPDPSLDVVVALLDAFDIRRLPDGVVTIAWVRNWTDRWISRPWFDEFDLVLASSHRSKELIDAAGVHVAEVMPIATNPERFRPAPPEAAGADGGRRYDVLFAGNRWGEPRMVEDLLLRLRDDGRSIRLHGLGWDTIGLGDLGGPLPYDDLPAAYAGAAIVLDDAAGPTKPYGSMNSRVFDALATGCLVITDNVIGAGELFDGLLPAADDVDGLRRLVDRYLGDPEARLELTGRLQDMVGAQHTYAHRARQLRDLLGTWAARPHVDIAVGPPSWEAATQWGDYHFGRAFQRALQRRGWAARLRLAPAWEGDAASRADVALHVFGLRPRRVRPAQVSVLWVISHPDLVTADMLHEQDLVVVASDRFAEALRHRTDRPVATLHQATDPDRFGPRPGGPVHDLLFVGNSRHVRRRVVDVITGAGRDLAVYGSGWTPDLLDPRHLRGTYVPNEELAAYYAAASIVLNDHWDDMAAEGFISNRLYDAAAAGAFVISDHVDGLEEEFDGGIVTFRDDEELLALVDRYLAAPAERAAAAARAHDAVLARHTFGHRAASFQDLVAPLLAGRQGRIGPVDGTHDGVQP